MSFFNIIIITLNVTNETSVKIIFEKRKEKKYESVLSEHYIFFHTKNVDIKLF